MKLRSVFDPQDISAGSSTNFLPSLDLRPDSGDETHPQDTPLAVVQDAPAAVANDASTNGSESSSTAPSFALLDVSTDQGHQAADPIETSFRDMTPGSGSIDVIGSPIQETGAGPNIGLHIAPLVDSGFTATEALFGPAASAPTPIASINATSLTPISFGHGAETAVGFAVAETAAASPVSHLGVTPTSLGAISAGLAVLDNGAPVTNADVGTAAATATQVKEALDESSSLIANGSGIKVGVLSDSFNDLGGAAADEADGALPSASNIQVLSDISQGGSDEGRAMMQIIHDIAPGSSLAFYTADNSEQDFANGILALAAAGCKVISDDVTYFDEPFFQNGIVAQAVQTVEAEGVTFVTSAGNDASNAYQAAWTPGSGFFDNVFFNDAELFNGNLAQTITVTASKSDPVPLILEWNLPYGQANFGSGNAPDIDLFVFHNGSLVAQETNVTAGEANNPFTGGEFTASGTYQIVIANNFGPNPGLIKEVLAGDGLPETISGANAGTVFGHHMTPGAITAGAVNAADTPAFGFSPISESFSSSGAGTELLFANNGTPLSSPDLLNPVAVSGVDGIATTLSGGLGDFFGTSAASASLAGVAALILEADPSLTSAQVEGIMEQTALSMSNPAVSGAGLAQVNPAVAAAFALNPPDVIQTDGSTALTEIANDYFLVTVGGVTGPELKYNGAAVVAGQFSGWTLIGAEATSTGYEVAWKDAADNLYTVWNTDSSGNFLNNPIGSVSPTSTALETLETSFHQDLNGDGVIGLATTVIESLGSTSLVEVGSNYFMNPVGGGTGPELKYNGAAVAAGQFGVWTLIGAEATSTGYEVAWKDAADNLYTVWNTDSSGNFLNNPIGSVSPTSTALETLETSFHQDLNGDGVIGLNVPTTVIEAHGSTSLVEVGNNYFMNPVGGGTGPELTYNGSPVVAGQFSGWTLIGAEATSTGYEVAWKDAADNLYTVWNTDSSGHFVNNPIGSVGPTSTALESLEPSFQQDLNGDGTIGVTAVSHVSSFTIKSVAVNPPSVTGSQPVASAMAAETATLSGAATVPDNFVFAPNFGQATIANYVPGSDTIEIDHTMFANVTALLAATHDDVNGNAVITDAQHDTITIKNVNTAQLAVHHADFHIL
ncbi:S8 family serine peptidase [Bradyrhizobium sp.]|uniref:S8 family serine peptidase n=1 Tax=Bradyrhizobium sp. TaxID=376 RepID=UPI0026363FE3|nr:S8 family serine peptidase [Bradyrhizobium sp.]